LPYLSRAGIHSLIRKLQPEDAPLDCIKEYWHIEDDRQCGNYVKVEEEAVLVVVNYHTSDHDLSEEQDESYD